jgi:hypothetical protein
MDCHNLSQADLLSIVSLRYAKNEALEPPWYGFFGIILREYLSRVEDKVATLFIPQLPITAEVDDVDIDEDDVSDDGDDEDHDIDGGYESPTPARATDVKPFHLVSHCVRIIGKHSQYEAAYQLSRRTNSFTIQNRRAIWSL